MPFFIRRAWELFLVWLATTSGTAAVSSIGAAVMACLAKLSAGISGSLYAPLLYGVIFTITFFILFFLTGIIKKPFVQGTYKIKTFVEFTYDGITLHQEDRCNVWGWRGISIGTLMSHESNPGDQVNQGSIWIISACFDKPISTDTILVSLMKPTGSSRFPCEWINYENRYSNIRLILSESGKYRVEYKYHGESNSNT